MRSSAKHLWSDESGAIAAVYALALPVLIVCGGVAFDYARLATMDSELQNAADQAALAAASQLDGKAGATQRASNAAQATSAGLVKNETRFANDGAGSTISVPTIRFLKCSTTACTDARAAGNLSAALMTEVVRDDTISTDDVQATFVEVTVDDRIAKYALTPIVGLLSSGNIDASAVAGLGAAICKVPPVMLCNPSEPSTNTDEFLAFTATPGTGMKLITGNADAPGNFGWLESGVDDGGANGANALKAALGYNTPPGECQPTTGVTTKTGMSTSVLSAFNTRFDVYANGANDCPSQFGGVCSPSRNSRKDLVCSTDNDSSTTCKGGWEEPKSPIKSYRPTTPVALDPATSVYPDIMGYPRDLCHAVKTVDQTCSTMGSGTWDRDAYFRVNYGWTSATDWQAGTGLSASATRYAVYNWEIANKTVNVSGVGNRGIDVPQRPANKTAAFGSPATGVSGITPGGTNVDRRRMSIAVINCEALEVKGKTTNVPVPTWLDVFLVEPAFQRGAGGPNQYTDQKEVYVEVIGPADPGSGGATAGQVTRRDVPYLVE
jgi:Flp pilus assembly protein TadG